jgi:hypothetical protein
MKLDASFLIVLFATTASKITFARFLEEEFMSADLSLSFYAGMKGTGMSKSGKKDPICKLTFAKTTPFCSVCEDQKFHFYDDDKFGRFCDRGFSLVEAYYFFNDFLLPAVPTAYKNIGDCCEDNGGCDDNNSRDYCLCDYPDPPDFCDQVTDMTSGPIRNSRSGK